MHLFKSKKKNILPFYNKIVLLTRKNYLYSDFNLPDTFSTRVYLILFHLSFIIVALNIKNYDKKYTQEIFDFFIKQIEVNCRELGFGDTHINKKMKKLIKLFYEILENCNKWKKMSVSEKKFFLSRFFNEESKKKVLIRKLTNYFSNFSLFIEDISLNLLTKGVFKFNYKD